MWKMTFTTIPKVTFCWQTKTCLSGALSSSHQQDAKLEEADPRQHRPLKHSTPFTVSMICSGTVHAQLQHKGRQPGLLSCLSFNWSDKPARPRYFRDGTVLLSIARRWVGKARVRSPPPRANAPATPAVPGLDSAREGSANHCRLCQTRGLCDVGRCLQRTRARPNQHLLWPKPERNPESKSTLQCKCRQTQPSSPDHTPDHTPVGAGNNREGRSTLRSERSSCLALGTSSDDLCPSARIRKETTRELAPADIKRAGVLTAPHLVQWRDYNYYANVWLKLKILTASFYAPNRPHHNKEHGQFLSTSEILMTRN